MVEKRVVSVGRPGLGPATEPRQAQREASPGHYVAACQGSKGESYQVNIKLGGSQISEASCTCPDT